MISRKLLWFIALALLGVFAVTWWAGSYPARVTLMNQSGAAVREVELRIPGQKIAVGLLGNGETRAVQIASGDVLELRFRGGRGKPIVWRSEGELKPAQSLVLYLTPTGRVDARARIGRLAR